MPSRVAADVPQLDHRLPADLRDGIGNFLQPRLVRPRAILEQRRRIDDEIHVARRALDVRARARGRDGATLRPLARQGAGAHSLDQRRRKGRRAAGIATDEILAVVRRRVRARELGIPLGNREQNVRRGLRIVHRIHPGLLQRDHAGEGLRVAPRLDRVVVGQHQIAELRRLVRIARERDLERHLRDRVGDLGALRAREHGVRAAHEEERHLPRAHFLDRIGELGVGRDPLEARDRLRAEHRAPDVAELLVERVHREAELHAATGEQKARPRCERRRQRLQRCGRHIRGLRSLGDGARASKRVRDRELGAGLARDPLVRVHPRERAPRTDVDHARRVGALRARIGERQLLRNVRAPRLEEIGAEGDDELRRGEVERRPRHAVALLVRSDHAAVRERRVAQVRGDAVAGEPSVQESREAPGLVLIDEERVPRLPRALHRRELLRQERDRLRPRDRRERAVLAEHRLPIAVRIVEPLHRRLSARAERPAIQRMIGIPLHLESASVAHFEEHAASRRALTAGGGVEVGDARHRLVGLHEIRNELLAGVRAAAHGRGRGAGCPEHLEKGAAGRDGPGLFDGGRALTHSRFLVVTRAAIVAGFPRRIHVAEVTVDAPSHVERRVLVDSGHLAAPVRDRSGR